MINSQLNIGISGYGDYSSKNYGVNCIRVQIGKLILWFSYGTVIAFSYDKERNLCISENLWNTTTGKHLNWINRDKKLRMDRKDFENELQNVLDELGLSINVNR